MKIQTDQKIPNSSRGSSSNNNNDNDVAIRYGHTLFSFKKMPLTINHISQEFYGFLVK